MRELLVTVLLLCGTCLTGQTAEAIRLTHKFENVALLDAITHLEKLYHLSFAFPREQVEQTRVNCSFAEASWEEVKQCLFAAHNLEAEWLKDGYINLRPLAPEAIQPWSICLQVLGDDEQPLPYATVALARTGLGANTDDDGRLTGPFKAAAADTLVVQYLGYDVQRLAVRDLVRQPCTTLRLRASSFELASVTVAEYLADGISATPDGRQVTFDVDKTPPLPGFAGTEVYRMLALLPGVNNSGETAGDLNIRGGSRDQNLILWDGIPVYTSGHYFSMISNFNAALIDDIDVWRGPAEASYGGRVSGVVQFNTDREVVSQVEAGGELSLLGTNLYAKVPVAAGKSDLHLGFSASLNGLLNGPTYQSYRDQVFQGDAFNTILRADTSQLNITEAFDFTEFNGRWQYNFSDRHRLTISGFSQRDDFRYTIFALRSSTRSFSEALSARSAGLSLNYEQDFRGGQQLKIQLIGTEFRNEGSATFEDRSDEAAEQRISNIQETSLRLHYDFKPLHHGQFKIGLQLQEYDYRSAYGFLSTLEDTSSTRSVMEN
ncbi:MAG: TonB-dependent receptor plug domain-containing protein, partial [Bacteroidota bacterium]